MERLSQSIKPGDFQRVRLLRRLTAGHVIVSTGFRQDNLISPTELDDRYLAWSESEEYRLGFDWLATQLKDQLWSKIWCPMCISNGKEERIRKNMDCLICRMCDTLALSLE